MPPKRKAALANRAIQSTSKRSRVNDEPLPEQRSNSASSSNAPPVSLSPDAILKLVREAFHKGLEEGRHGTSSADPANTHVLPSTCRGDSVHTDRDFTMEQKNVAGSTLSTTGFSSATPTLATQTAISVSIISGVVMASAVQNKSLSWGLIEWELWQDAMKLRNKPSSSSPHGQLLKDHAGNSSSADHVMGAASPIDVLNIPQITFLSIMLLTIVIGNACVLAAIMLSDNGRKTRMNFFIMHLAISDLSVGMFLVSIDLAEKIFIEWLAGNALCKIINFLKIVVLYASTYVLVSLSIDRFDAIARPMNFSRRAFRARMLIYSAWILAGIFSMPALVLFEARTEPQMYNLTMCTINLTDFHWKLYFTLVALSVFIIPAVIITVCYSVIIIIICQKSKLDGNNAKQVIPRQNEGGVYDVLGTANHFFGKEFHVIVMSCAMFVLQTVFLEGRGFGGARHGKGTSVIQQAKIRTIKMTFIIVLVFVLCWCPYIVFNLLHLYAFSDEELTSPVLGAATAWIQSMAPLNSAANPIIYGVFSTRICRNLRRIPLFNCIANALCRCQRVRSVSGRLSHTTSWNDPTYMTDASFSSKYRRPGVRRTLSDSESTILASGRHAYPRGSTQHGNFRRSISSSSQEFKPIGYRRPSGLPLVKRNLTFEDNHLLKSITQRPTKTICESEIL
ncbi:cardioacceleratory peptide receptor-like [Pecten maximus]|uniref:cardioacceleratory peptide receptor-like n=1 Tax=Pecten maximus TaxID=6579 RepID=UPI0014581F93|nr:cardioacceleratory peptide receptor-like [Pecten maximus]